MLDKKVINLMLQISITDLLGKLPDTIQYNMRLAEDQNQSSLQFGFTKSLFPTKAALILSEAIIDARESHTDLHIATLDTQKAFDVVHHPTLLRRLYLDGMNTRDWLLTGQMYTEMTTQIKWKGVYKQISILMTYQNF